MFPGTEPKRFFFPDRDSGLSYARTQGQLEMSSCDGNIPTRLFLCPAPFSPQPSLPLPLNPSKTFPFYFLFLNWFLLLTTRNPNSENLVTFPLDLYSGLLQDIISPSPNSHTEPSTCLLRPDLCYSVNKTVGCAMGHHRQAYGVHLGTPLKKMNCLQVIFPHSFAWKQLVC